MRKILLQFATIFLFSAHVYAQEELNLFTSTCNEDKKFCHPFLYPPDMITRLPTHPSPEFQGDVTAVVSVDLGNFGDHVSMTSYMETEWDSESSNSFPR